MTFAGVPFVEPVPEVMTLVDRWWVEEAPELWRHPGYSLERLHHLPVPDRPNQQRARLNTLYWPGGASRWGVFHGLVNGDDLALMQATCGVVSPVAKPFVMTLETGTVAVGMFLLEDRPAYVGGVQSTRLYHVTLVDQRYYWWTRPLAFTYDEGDAWEILLNNLVVAASGLTPTVPVVPAAYGTPSSARWVVRSRPLPLLVDAAAASVGLRFVPSTDGTVAYVSATDALTADLTQYVANVPPSYGGRLAVVDAVGNVPASVDVVFWGDNPTTVNVTLASLALAQYGTITGVANTRAFVGLDQRSELTPPVPATAATQAATDFYLWALSLTDATFAGVRAVQLTGLEDRIEWEWHPGRRARTPSPTVERTTLNPIDEADGIVVQRVLTRIVPSDWHDRNVYGDRPPPGYTYAVKLLLKTAGEDRWKATTQVRDPAAEVIVDGPQLGWGDDSYVLLTQPGVGAVGDYGTAVPDPFVANRWEFVPSSGGVRDYDVRLTEFGTGIDGGIAWNGYPQIENASGVVVDAAATIGGTGANRFVMYPTAAADGSNGIPEVDDIVVAIPNPRLAGRWTFIPKLITGFECGECCWLGDVPQKTCWKIRMIGGDGRCSCIPTEGFESSGSAVWVPALDGWVANQMKSTCCGCGGAILKITGNCTATLTLTNFHVSCNGSSGSGELFTLVMNSACCGINKKTGKPYIRFVGGGTDACSGDQEPCKNTFAAIAECFECPEYVCNCCCGGPAPNFWYQKDVIDFASNHLNGMWVWQHDDSPEAPGCRWFAECYGISSVLEYDPDAVVYRLTHDTAIYELPAGDWACDGPNIMLYVSGASGAHPGQIEVKPGMVVEGTDNPCALPDNLTIALASSACAIFNVTVTVTRTAPGSGNWEYSNLGDGSRVTAVTLVCGEDGTWSMSATAQCLGDDDVLYAYEMHTILTPDTFETNPLEVVWTGVPITGDDPPHVPACCVDGATATVTVTE